MNDLQAALARVGELPEKWRAEAEGDQRRANEAREKGDLEIAALRLGYATVQRECADELAAIICQHLPELQACVRDAGRYKWLRERHDDETRDVFWHVRDANAHPIAIGKLDAAIDAAIEEGG